MAIENDLLLIARIVKSQQRHEAMALSLLSLEDQTDPLIDRCGCHAMRRRVVFHGDRRQELRKVISVLISCWFR